jgi:hypothetical protein
VGRGAAINSSAAISVRAWCQTLPVHMGAMTIVIGNGSSSVYTTLLTDAIDRILLQTKFKPIRENTARAYFK